MKRDSVDTNLVVLMSGRGSRFTNNGYKTPKPLLEIDGAPMFVSATNSILNEHTPRKLIFTVLTEHIVNFHIDRVIGEYFPEASIVEFNEVTRGPLESLVASSHNFIENIPVISTDCDHAFKNKAFMQFLNSESNNETELAFPLFSSENPSFSYAVTDETKVIEIAEKQRISNNAICSVYFIRSQEILKDAFNQELKEIEGEMYLSSLARNYLKNNRRVSAFPSEEVKIYGTPDSFEHGEVYLRDSF